MTSPRIAITDCHHCHCSCTHNQDLPACWHSDHTWPGGQGTCSSRPPVDCPGGTPRSGRRRHIEGCGGLSLGPPRGR